MSRDPTPDSEGSDTARHRRSAEGEGGLTGRRVLFSHTTESLVVFRHPAEGDQQAWSSRQVVVEDMGGEQHRGRTTRRDGHRAAVRGPGTPRGTSRRPVSDEDEVEESTGCAGFPARRGHRRSTS